MMVTRLTSDSVMVGSVVIIEYVTETISRQGPSLLRVLGRFAIGGPLHVHPENVDMPHVLHFLDW